MFHVKHLVRMGGGEMWRTAGHVRVRACDKARASIRDTGSSPGRVRARDKARA